MATVTLVDLEKNKVPGKGSQKNIKGPHQAKKKSLKSFEESYKNPVLGKEDISQVEDLKKELIKLKEENDSLKSNKPLTKNEEKLLNAIRSESIEQKTDLPTISTSVLRKKHKVSAKYQSESIRSLVGKSLIKREETPFSGNVKTYRWQILKH